MAAVVAVALVLALWGNGDLKFSFWFLFFSATAASTILSLRCLSESPLVTMYLEPNLLLACLSE